MSNLNILGREADFAGTGIILRGPDAAARAQELIDAGIVVVNPLPGGSAANIEVLVDGRSQNLGVSRMKGFDIDARHALPGTRVGDFQFSLTGTWMTDFDVAITAVATPVDRLNTIFNPLKLKLRAAAMWSNGPYQATLSATRVGSYRNTVVTPAQTVKPYMPVDLTFGLDLGGMGLEGIGEDLSLGLELRNAFDEDPPYVNLAPGVNGSGGYDATSSNPVGRLLAVSLRKKW